MRKFEKNKRSSLIKITDKHTQHRALAAAGELRLPDTDPLHQRYFGLSEHPDDETLDAAKDANASEDEDNRSDTSSQAYVNHHPTSGPEVVDAMSSKQDLQDALVRQLKTVIRAQHAKIEELRATAEGRSHETDEKRGSQESFSPEAHDGLPSRKVLGLMIEDLRRDATKHREDLAMRLAQVRRLQNTVEDLRASNQDLKAHNKRYKNLADAGNVAMAPSALATSETPSELGGGRNSSALEAPLLLSPSPSLQSLQLKQLLASGSSPLSPSPPGIPSGGALTARRGKAAVGAHRATGTARLSQATRGVMALWREDTPKSILTCLMDSATNLLQGGAPAILTLFVTDPWLRRAMAGGEEGSDECRHQSWQPTKFYLTGKVTVHAYQRQGGRVEPPRFADLSQLPYRRIGQLALPLQSSDQPVTAALQVVIPQAVSSSQRGLVTKSSRVRTEFEGAIEAEGQPVQEHLTDAQLSGLQLLCDTAANIIHMRLKSAEEQAIRKRSQECLTITAEISSVARLTDFEQSAKILLMKFFNVACVRICFFDSDSRSLLTVPTRPHRSGVASARHGADEESNAAMVGRRQLMRIAVSEGIVGKCTRKLEVMLVEPLIMSADVSERADGIDMSDRSPHLNMLTGPMLANLSDRILIIGTLQLIEKKSDAGASSAWKAQDTGKTSSALQCIPFTEEDQKFFAEMLKILGTAAYRTMQLQARHAKDDVEINVEKLLER